MSDKRLLPCPFCGGEAEIHDYTADGRTYFFAECLKCGTTSAKISRGDVFFNEKAIENAEKGRKAIAEAWNTRKPMERIVERLEEASFPHKFGSEVQMMILKNRAIEIVKEEGLN